MKGNHNLHLNRLEGERFIEIYRLEDIVGDTVFNNYQRYDFYQVLWFTKAGGDRSYFLDFEEYTVEDNQVILIFPGQIDRLDPKDKEGFLFAVNNDSFYRINQRMQCDYLNGYYSNVFVALDKKTQSSLKTLTELMLTEYGSENRILLMENYMEAFLFHISCLFDSSNNQLSKTDSQVAELMRLIDKHYVNQRETEFYAEILGMTHKRLNEMTVKGTGKTVKQHLQDRLILEIKKEIRLRNKNLKEIAYDLGFSEPGYFTRFFKQQTGITPTEFRDNV